MKKRKTYEISVIDKTYSKTISDETKFYTSDTALELVFKLKETEYTFESAEIVLLNIDDRSLVTRAVTKSLDSFTYELEDDITDHYGEWRGQVRFEQAGETYVSSPVKFRIENDLGNERPPQLSDAQSWVSLKRYADDLTEELKQAVLSIEGIEGTLNENETIRQSNFETAEQSRQATFEYSESKRDETFSTNEATRKTQELEREEAEATRQTTFDSNEANRTETFNTNEATRQENESVRQQSESQRQSTFEVNEIERQNTFETAEQERQSAEIIRVENENQRVLTYDSLQETIDMIGKVKLENLVENGDFSDGLTGWNVSSGSSNLTNVEYHTPPNSFYKPNARATLYRNITLPSNHITYLSTFIKGTNRMELRMNEFGTWTRIVDVIVNGSDDWTLLSLTGRSVNGGIRMDTSASDGENFFDDFIALDLTSIFGAGNEPTKEIMDWIVRENGYFDELTLRRDDIQQYEINQLRNAVIALGGTI